MSMGRGGGAGSVMSQVEDRQGQQQGRGGRGGWANNDNNRKTRSSWLNCRYEVMKLCAGLEKDSNGWDLVVLSQYETDLER